ncbi:MAG: hypothetical protein QGG09_21445, partial [Pirellulaceae bacterium]|nr:hypothetical protein [Pirellulaceae bacterium]
HGRLYAFTTLRPPPPPDGSLRLWAVSENGVNGVLLSVLFVVGVVFLPRSFSAKLFALALLLIGVVLAGVFAPTLAMQIIDTWLAVGVALVVFVWIVAAVYTSRNQLSAVFARATATRAETETQSAAATQSDDSSVAEDVTAEEGTGAADGDLETDEQGGSPFAGEPTDDDHNTQGGETNA